MFLLVQSSENKYEKETGEKQVDNKVSTASRSNVVSAVSG
jgi:hypothetical protein